MVGNASCVASVRIVGLELLDRDSPPDGMPITQCAIPVTSKETKGWLAQFVEGPIDIQPKKK
jgi:hypothetical protein